MLARTNCGCTREKVRTSTTPDKTNLQKRMALYTERQHWIGVSECAILIPSICVSQNVVALAVTSPGDATMVSTNVLLIEDSGTDPSLVQQMLADTTCHVSKASTVADALSQLDKTDVHAILLDLDLPGNDGLETVSRQDMSPRYRGD